MRTWRQGISQVAVIWKKSWRKWKSTRSRPVSKLWPTLTSSPRNSQLCKKLSTKKPILWLAITSRLRWDWKQLARKVLFSCRWRVCSRKSPTDLNKTAKQSNLFMVQLSLSRASRTRAVKKSTSRLSAKSSWRLLGRTYKDLTTFWNCLVGQWRQTKKSPDKSIKKFPTSRKWWAISSSPRMKRARPLQMRSRTSNFSIPQLMSIADLTYFHNW